MNRQSAEGAKTQSKGFMPLIAELYAQLPGVKAAEADGYERYGSTYVQRATVTATNTSSTQ